MSEGVVVYQSDANVFRSIEKWNHVMKALETLYKCYTRELRDCDSDDVLIELMQAYDEWLD